MSDDVCGTSLEATESCNNFANQKLTYVGVKEETEEAHHVFESVRNIKHNFIESERSFYARRVIAGRRSGKPHGGSKI